MRELLKLLDPDVVLRSDGGGKVATLPRIVRGAARVASALLHYAPDPTVDAGRITAIDTVRNPDKLARVPDLG